jgi:glycosyltransferase involved in cell wall biosynthesis
MNLPFCVWLYARHSGAIVMFHEVMFPQRAGQSINQKALAAVTRLMAFLTARSASSIFVATPTWQRMLRQYAGVKGDASWLPVPSNIPVINDPTGVSALRCRYASGDDVILGHFSTYPNHIAETLAALLPVVLADHSSTVAVLIGANSCRFRAALIDRHPEITQRLYATGILGAEDLSRTISACDLMIQPYGDGASTRRTTLMAGLAHGRAVVTNAGLSTESLWAETGAVALTPAGDIDSMRTEVARILADETHRNRYSQAAIQLYAQRFDIAHTISALQSA